ncbi:MAG: protein kinase domain-containing protein [Armatimonadota bacterium]
MVGSFLKHRYKVIEKIGEDNLFTVYKCEDVINKRTTAAKVLLPQYASNRTFAERILVEAEALIGISHPGIVQVFDCGEDEGSYFVIIEYIRGIDMQEHIRRSAPFNLSTSVDIGLALCSVLDFAHSKGFIHGDLKPANIMVTTEGQIKIADFWVSNAVSASQSIRTSVLMRSVHYMSPEIAEGQPSTPSSDIYSLGIIMFQLLTGTLPFDGDTPISIALKHSKEPVPSIRSINPGVPKTLESVISTAMQKSPADRFRSARAMILDLTSVRDALNLSAPLVWSNTSGKSANDPDEEMEEGESALLIAVRRALIILVMVIMVLGAGMAAYFYTKPADVVVPNLIGKSFEEAESLVSRAKLKLSVNQEQFNEKYPSDTIYFMVPMAGRTLKQGRTVEVWISKGSKYALVPSVLKIPLEDAQRKIMEAGLNVGEVTQDYNDNVPAGNVSKQDPSSGTKTERNTPVNLVYSLGPKVPEETVTDDNTATNSETSGQSRSFDVKFTVPAGPEQQNIEIAVLDDYGENIVYTEVKSPGDKIEQSVDGVGRNVAIRIYIDGKLVKEERR